MNRNEQFLLLKECSDILKNEPNLLRLRKKNIVVVGDVHGSKRAVSLALEISESFDGVIFLGDYVDRGPYQIEAVNLVLSAKLERPKSVFLLRGNHELPYMNEVYGFRHVVETMYDYEMWMNFNMCFSYLPYVGVLGDVMLVHGGISEGIKSIEDVDVYPKGMMVPPPEIEELLWNDPMDGISDFVFNEERMGFKKFGRGALIDFLKRNSLSRLIRGHQPVKDGFYEMWDGKIITVFSSPETHPNKKGALLIFESGEFHPVAISSSI